MKSVTPSYIRYIENLFKINKENKIIRNIISNIKKRNYQITDREYTQLERFKRGDVTSYSPKNEITLLREYIKKRILEAILTKHYLDRKKERGEGIFDVFIPNEAFENLSQKDKVKLKNFIIENIKSSLLKNLKLFEKQKFLYPENVIVIYKVFHPKLKLLDNKIIDLNISTTFKDDEGKFKNMYGNGFYALVVNSEDSDKILSFLLDNNIENNENLISKTLNSRYTRELFQKIRQTIKAQVIESPLYNQVYDLKSILNNLNLYPSTDKNLSSKTNTPELPYEVKDSYPVGTIIKYKGKGTGEVIRTSSGPKGEGDSSGKLQWVEVDFPRGAIKLPNIFTTAYFK